MVIPPDVSVVLVVDGPGGMVDAGCKAYAVTPDVPVTVSDPLPSFGSFGSSWPGLAKNSSLRPRFGCGSTASTISKHTDKIKLDFYFTDQFRVYRESSALE